MMQNLRIRCKNADSGCEFVDSYDKIMEHQKHCRECQECKVKCTKEAHCRDFVKVKLYEDHKCVLKANAPPRLTMPMDRRRVLMNRLLEQRNARELLPQRDPYGDEQRLSGRNSCVRCCIKFQRLSTDRNDGLSAVGGLFFYFLDFLIQNLMNLVLAYYLHSQRFLNPPTKGAFYFFSVVYYVLTFVPPFFGAIHRWNNFRKFFMLFLMPFLIFTTSFQLTLVLAPCRLRRSQSYLGSNDEIR